jgi:histidyl-tRNA synthetase
MARLRAPRGTEDLLPERIPFYDRVFDTCRRVIERHGYREIRTPLFEDTSLFVRSLGEATDVVEKEMFTATRGDTSVSFRPEATASVARAYLEHNLDKTRAFQKLYYIGPMFRFERPQAGRQRQFYQIGIEALGSRSPLLDAEVMSVAHRCFEALELRNFRIHVNSVGDGEDRARYRAVLSAHMAAVLDQRCDDCRARFTRNVFRMLDCKVPSCQPSNASAPHILDHLSAESRARFDGTLAGLETLSIPFTVDHGIVRGLDYYTHTVFEIRCPDLGARDAICGGGRYDRLTADLGGPEVGCSGFAIGVTPTMVALELQGHPAAQPAAPRIDVFVAPVDEAQRTAAFALTDRLRRAGVETDTDYEDKSLKAVFKTAHKRGVVLMVVLGADEIAQGVVKVKDFRSGEEHTLHDDERLAGELAARLAQRPAADPGSP